MRNELLLAGSLLFIFSMVLVWYKLFGAKGLMCFSVLAAIAANIEVMILIHAFGMDQTLGNVLFASNFLITDILSETEGKKTAQTTVRISVLGTITFLILSQSWLLYNADNTDGAFDAIRTVFSGIPRVMFASLLVYAISQWFDVWAYHKWWEFTDRKFGSHRKYLWLRNNGSTLISQLLNTLLFTYGAFWGVYDGATLVSIVLSSYVIFIFTSLLDTPFVYLARRIHEREKIKNKND